jgi:hypothetical protein
LSARPARWRDSVLGGHRLRAACVLEVTAPGAEALRSDVAARLEQIHFRRDGYGEQAAAGAWVLRRGTVFGDILLTGTGLGLIVGTKLGPLSYRGIVIIEVILRAEGTERLVASLVTGDELGPEFAEAVDMAVEAAVDAGVGVTGPGWMRAVDVPAESLGHPKTRARRSARDSAGQG